jgi:PAS domain S-box-containing protein
MTQRPGNSYDLPAAAELLGLSVESVQALVGAGYLRPATRDPSAGPSFALGDLKAFLARNTGEASPEMFGDAAPDIDPQALLDALDGHSDDMARRAFDIFTTVFPEASGWTLTEQARFIEQARKRFEAILAVTGQGEEVDEALVGDLQDVGASAAWSGSPLPQLLVVLRISRDLVVQTAVELAEERGRHWGLSLSLLLTRVLPAMDRLTDAIAQGYWAAVVGREEENRARYENVVEHSSDGIYEIDLDGFVQYANPSLAVILGMDLDVLSGGRITDAFVPADGTDVLELLTSEEAADGARVELAVLRTDGVRRLLEIRTLLRREEGTVVGYAGIVRDITASNELEQAKNEFLALITHDLRNPLTTVLGLGVTLETYASELPAERLQRMGSSIRRQSERIARLADDLYDVSQLESRALELSVRPCDLLQTIDVALASVDHRVDEVEVRVVDKLDVLADPRRLEQVVANLVENGLAHGAPPVVIEASLVVEGGMEMAAITITDSGPGVPEPLVPTLFSSLRTFARRDRDRSRGTGLGLSLVRGLVEAMGGRVTYERSDTGGARFRLTVPLPRRR